MASLNFKPKTTLKRHQKYLGAFSYSNVLFLLKKITRFINDKNISHLNADDLAFFKHLLYDTNHKNVCILYYRSVGQKNKLVNGFYPTIKNIARYCDFLNEISVLHVEDLFHLLIVYKPKTWISRLFDYLTPSVRLRFIKLAPKYLKICSIPKLKLYLTFS